MLLWSLICQVRSLFECLKFIIFGFDPTMLSSIMKFSIEPFIFMNKKPIVWKLQRIKKWSPSHLGVGMYSFGTNSMIKNSMPFRTLWFDEGLSIFVSKKPSTFFGFCGKVGTVGYIIHHEIMRNSLEFIQDYSWSKSSFLKHRSFIIFP